MSDSYVTTIGHTDGELVAYVFAESEVIGRARKHHTIYILIRMCGVDTAVLNVWHSHEHIVVHTAICNNCKEDL